MDTIELLADRPAAGPTGAAPPAPPPCRSLEDVGVSPNDLAKLLLKVMQATGLETPSRLGDYLKLPTRAVRELLEDFQERALVSVLGAVDMHLTSELRYTLSQAGREAAADARRENGYVGPAPVSLSAYCDQIRRQRITDRAVGRDAFARVLTDMVVAEPLIRQLGPAVNAGRAILLYGPPGNGKTTLGRKVADLYEDWIYVPYCFEVDGQIVKVFDPQVHEEAPEGPQRSGSDLRLDTRDARWVQCRRPVVVTGGELTLEMLDLSFEGESRFYEAPLHIKALGGVFILDDFGRQLVTPEALLNRWTAPLESRVDFLKLHTGKSFALPFDALVVFSTNLEPEKLMDPAFLRRIPYKIGVFAPSESEYRRIFHFIAARQGVAMGEAALDLVMAKLKERPWIPLANYQPGFILDQVRSASKFEGVPLQFRPDFVDLALDNLGSGLVGIAR